MYATAKTLAIVVGAAWLQLAVIECCVAAASLADAVENRDADAVRTLLEHKADVNAKQADGMTALHWAALHDDADMSERLISAGADAKAANRYGVTPLLLACTNGNSAIVKMLLAAGADVNTTGPGGASALMIASRTGRLGPVEALLARGADVDAREQKNQTALMWAAAAGNTEVVDALLKKGADSRTPLASGFTPFFFAVREGQRGVALRLVQAGVDVNEIMKPAGSKNSHDKQSSTALILAIENGHFELAAALLNAGADPNVRPAGYTALHAITWVRKPLRGDGNPPPIGSGNMSSRDIVRQLTSHGADMNARLEHGAKERGRFTTTGSSPFLLAARASDVALMNLLLELGADPKLTNADNCTPLLAAAGVGALENGEETAGTEDEAIETVKMLLDDGADVNAVDDNGETAMHGAAYQSRSQLVQLLAERGADINIWNRKNTSGWTPLMIAQGHRPGNFRPAPETIVAIERAMRAAGVDPPKATGDAARRGY
jgi:uncharacterized protein